MSLSTTLQMKSGDGTQIRCETIIPEIRHLSPYPVLRLRQYGLDPATYTHRDIALAIIADMASLAALRDELNRYFATEEATDPNVIDYRPATAKACT